MAKPALVVALALVAVACSASDRHQILERAATATGTRAAVSERATVLGLLSAGERTALARLDARTLRRVGASVEVGGVGSHAFSPNRRTLAVASAGLVVASAPPGRSMLTLVDVRTLRRRGRLELRGRGFVSDIHWSEPDRLVVLRTDPTRVVTLATRPLRATSKLRLPGSAVATDVRAGRLVVLLAPSARSIGASRLAVVEADGRVRTLALDEVLSGWEPVELDGDPYGMRQRIPGLAVSPDGERAVVVPAGDRIASVDLDSLRVSYHELSERVSLFRRLSNWLEPEAQAKTVEGTDRLAKWVGDDQVAVTGTTYAPPGDEGRQGARAGLRLIDTEDWTVRTLSKEAAGMLSVCDLVLAYAWATSAQNEAIGLRAYGPDGEQRFHLFGEQPLDWIESACPYAYVPRHGGRRFDVVDVRSGRVVARPNPGAAVSIVEP